MEDLEEVPSSWLQIGSALAITAIWGVNQQMEVLSLFFLFFFNFFLKIYFYYFFIGKADIQRGDTERKIFRPMIHSPSEHNDRYYAGPKPGASSGSPTRVQGPKAAGHPRLLSQATSRELDGKQGCWD